MKTIIKDFERNIIISEIEMLLPVTTYIKVFDVCFEVKESTLDIDSEILTIIVDKL